MISFIDPEKRPKSGEFRRIFEMYLTKDNIPCWKKCKDYYCHSKIKEDSTKIEFEEEMDQVKIFPLVCLSLIVNDTDFINLIVSKIN